MKGRLTLTWSLWAVVALTGWMVAIQAIHMGLSFQAQWQAPRIRKVAVLSVDRDPEKQFLELVKLHEPEGPAWRSFTKAEAAELEPGEEVWVLDNFFVTPLRPECWRLSPFRLFWEFPHPVLGLALFLLWVLRRLPPPREPERQTPRTVLKDDFHARAEERRR